MVSMGSPALGMIPACPSRFTNRMALLDRRFLLSAPFRLYPDDVGIGTSASAVVGAYLVIIIHIGVQAGNICAGHVPDIQVLITGYVSGKGFVCGYVQAITGRAS